MATPALPAAAHIRELRLAISAGNNEARRPLNRKAPYAAAYREYWAGEVLFAPTSPSDGQALAAFLESLDGRVLPFRLPLTPFSVVHANTGGTLGADVARGADTLRVTKASTNPLLRGTLLAIGNIDTTAFQLVEVIHDGPGGTSETVYIAPRIGQAFSGGTTVAIGAVSGKFTLAGDISKSVNVSSGLVSVSVIEAV